MQRVFRWVSGAKRALRLDELEEAVGLDSNDECLPTNRIARGAGERLVSDCGNLVIHDAGDNTVGFAHHTVHQYLCEASKDRQTALLSTDFDAVSVNGYIGEICLAYLCFSDFETQLVKVPKKMEIQRKAAEQLLWWGVPFAPILKRAIIWTRSSTSEPPSTSSRHIPLALPAYAKPSASWTRKFSLLEYIVAYWAFHAANITRSSSSWSKFQDVALNRQLLFEFRPWHEPQHRAKVKSTLADMQVQNADVFPRGSVVLASHDYMLLYAWAMAGGVASLLTLIDPTDIDPYPKLVPAKAAGRNMVNFEIFYGLMKEESSPSRVLHQGFWNGNLLYRAAGDILTLRRGHDHKVVLDLCFDEYNRWTDTDALSFELFHQDAILCAVEKVDVIVYQRLIKYHVHDFQQLMSTLACLILANQAKAFAIRGLLTLDLGSTNDLSPRLQSEIMFALAQCMPAIQAILEVDANLLSKVNERLWAILAVATLVSGQETTLWTVLPVIDKLLETRFVLIGSDWMSTVFGTKKAYDRLVSVLDSYTSYTWLLQDLTRSPRSVVRATKFYRGCQCQLNLPIILFQYEMGLCDDTHDEETLLSAYQNLAGCHWDSSPSDKLLRWSVKKPDAVWKRVIALPLPKYAFQDAYNTLAAVKQSGEVWCLDPKDERFQERLAHLKAKISSN